MVDYRDKRYRAFTEQDLVDPSKMHLYLTEMQSTINSLVDYVIELEADQFMEQKRIEELTNKKQEYTPF